MPPPISHTVLYSAVSDLVLQRQASFHCNPTTYGDTALIYPLAVLTRSHHDHNFSCGGSGANGKKHPFLCRSLCVRSQLRLALGTYKLSSCNPGAHVTVGPIKEPKFVWAGRRCQCSTRVNRIERWRCGLGPVLPYPEVIVSSSAWKQPAQHWWID